MELTEKQIDAKIQEHGRTLGQIQTQTQQLNNRLIQISNQGLETTGAIKQLQILKAEMYPKKTPPADNTGPTLAKKKKKKASRKK